MRLLTVLLAEHAIAAVFRMTRLANEPLLPTLDRSARLLLHFRYNASIFVSALSEYLFDVAIGAHFDAFLERLELSSQDDGDSSFSDIFALATGHAYMLDDVLSACLLRSTQRTAGDTLRQILEIVLQFAVLVGELKRGRSREYEGSMAIDKLHRSFRKRMVALVGGSLPLWKVLAHEDTDDANSCRSGKIRGYPKFRDIQHR